MMTGFLGMDLLRLITGHGLIDLFKDVVAVTYDNVFFVPTSFCVLDISTPGGILLSFASDPRQGYHPNSYPNLYSDPIITLNLILNPTPNLQRISNRHRQRRSTSGSQSGSSSGTDSDSDKPSGDSGSSSTSLSSAAALTSSAVLSTLESMSSLWESLTTLSPVSSLPSSSTTTQTTTTALTSSVALLSSTETTTTTLASLATSSFLSQSSASPPTSAALSPSPSPSTSASLAPSAAVSIPSSESPVSSLPSSSTTTQRTTTQTTTTALTSLATSSFLSQSSASPSPSAALSPSPSPSTSASLAPSAAVSIPSSKELVRKFISSVSRIDFQRETSLQDAVDLLQKFIEEYENESVQERRNGILFNATIAFESFVLKYGQHHLNESTPVLNKAYNILDLGIQRVFSRNASDFHLKGSVKPNFISIPSDNFHDNGSVLVGIVYKYLHEDLISTENNRKLNTMIMAATMDPKPKQLQQNVVLNFRNLKVGDGGRYCNFWRGYSETSPDGWSEEGCHVAKSKSSSGQTQCSCNHMTHFAVLFDYGENTEITESDEKILTIITYVGLSLSIVGLFLTIIAYARLTDVYQPLSQIRMSLAGSLGAAQVIFLGGINFTENTVVCVTVAALIQYFLIAAFCWMLVEGIYLYLYVVKVYNINNKMKMYYVMSWGFPAVMVAISLSISVGKGGIQSFVSDKYCWMSPDSEVIWTFAAFLAMIEVINLLLLMRVIWEMAAMQPNGEHHIQRIRVSIKACLMLIPLLGVTWLFGLLSPFHLTFVYIFTILNSTQGFLIFLLHCIRNSQIRERFKRRMNAIFPGVYDENPAKKTSQSNRSHVGAPKKIKVLPYHNNEYQLK